MNSKRKSVQILKPSNILSWFSNYPHTSFEHALFNIVIVIGILIGASSTVVNILAGVNIWVHLVNLIFFASCAMMYYYSRFRNIYERLIIPLIVMTLLVLDALWISAGGMDSPMVYYIFLSTVCFLIFSKPNQVMIISVISVINLALLVTLEGTTNLVLPYPNQSVRFLDLGISSILGLILMIILIRWFKYNYEIERQSVIEKNERIETLMRELHHRVKNNLQVISSLLGLQSMRLDDKNAIKAVNEGKERIRAMSLIHQKLYQQDEITALNIRDYINNLVAELEQSYGFSGKAKIHVDVPSVLMDVDTTLPVGLIINEMVSNAFKYAYQNIQQPVLKLKLVQNSDSNFTLSISDNGAGLPDSFIIEEAKSFGFKLVNLLTRQLKGELQIFNNNGLNFELSFSTG